MIPDPRAPMFGPSEPKWDAEKWFDDSFKGTNIIQRSGDQTCFDQNEELQKEKNRTE